MRLTMASHTDQLTRVLSNGEITQYVISSDPDPFDELLGSAIYRHHVLLNLENTPYIDSSGISWLLGAHKRFERGGGKLVLHSLPPAVDQVLRLLKLTSLLHVAVGEPEAIQIAAEAKTS